MPSGGLNVRDNGSLRYDSSHGGWTGSLGTFSSTALTLNGKPPRALVGGSARRPSTRHLVPESCLHIDGAADGSHFGGNVIGCATRRPLPPTRTEVAHAMVDRALRFAVRVTAQADIPGVYCYGPGQCILSAKAPDSDTSRATGLGSSTPMHYLATAPGVPPSPSGTPIQIYIVFGNSTVNATWSGSEKTVVSEILGALGTSSAWRWMGAIYPLNPDMGLASPWPAAQLINCLSGSPPHCVTATCTSRPAVAARAGAGRGDRAYQRRVRRHAPS